MKMLNENYESPIESMLGPRLKTALHDGVTCRTQHRMTACGNRYRADFYLERDGRRCVIEADGKDFHSEARDWRRDMEMFEADATDDVIRFRGTDIYFSLDKCIDFIGCFAPYLTDRERKPMSADDLLLQSVMVRHAWVRPCLRTCVPTDELMDTRRAIEETGVMHVWGTAREAAVGVIQVHCPDHVRIMRHDRIWHLGDYTRYMAEKIL